jgi:predicted nicotinamide N-methyase
MREINGKNINLKAEAKLETTSGIRLKELAALNDELAKIVAKNVAAPSELLTGLAYHSSKAVRKAVTSNPNTPKKILFDLLSVYFPRELLNNPIFDFSLLGDLTFIRKIPSRVLFILMQQNNIPQFLVNYAVNHPVKMIAELAKMQVFISGEMT